MVHGLDTLTSLYLYGFILGSVLTMLYVLFGDALDGIFDITPGSFLSPTVLLSFFAIFSGSGFILSFLTSWDGTLIFLMSLVISLLLVTLMHIFIISPISKTEQSTAFDQLRMAGKVGTVTLTIPADGYGQVSLKSDFGYNTYAAQSSNAQSIPEGSLVRIVKVDDHIYIVEPFTHPLEEN
ncbi:hypothetical protein CN918_25830 [Priestia megaterium]|nr:hypothetical protein CN918_25830 [Priestia megaterium]